MCKEVKVTFTWLSGSLSDGKENPASRVSKTDKILYDEYIALLSGGLDAQKAYILGKYDSLSPDSDVNRVRMILNEF